ncbi:MAG: hypothetical protein PHX78_11665 [bacterium]|nr:hypothetical protein [bacterium]
MKKNALFIVILLFCLSLSVFAEGKPKIAIIILEENVDKKSTTVTETKLKGVFEKKGFNVVESVFKEVLSAKNYPSDDEKIKALIKNLNAEIVVIGRAVVIKAGDKNNKVIYSADISVNAFKTDDMQVLGASKNQAVSTNADPLAGGPEALEKASSELAENLANQVLKKWASKIQN